MLSLKDFFLGNPKQRSELSHRRRNPVVLLKLRRHLAHFGIAFLHPIRKRHKVIATTSLSKGIANTKSDQQGKMPMIVRRTGVLINRPQNTERPFVDQIKHLHTFKETHPATSHLQDQWLILFNQTRAGIPCQQRIMSILRKLLRTRHPTKKHVLFLIRKQLNPGYLTLILIESQIRHSRNVLISLISIDRSSCQHRSPFISAIDMPGSHAAY